MATPVTPSKNAPAPGRHAVLSGGGTGGHVFPALAVATELEQRGWRVSYVGQASGIEARLVAAQGITFHDLPARPWLGRGPIGKGLALFTLVRSAWRARNLVRRLGARVVVGTGGYVAAPAVIGARLAARPALLVEPNAQVGLANRWLSRFATEAAVAYPETAAALRCPAQVTGVPVRPAIAAIAEGLPPSPPLRLLVAGGSQGAVQLNRLVPLALARIAGALPRLAVCHQAGRANLEATRAAYAEAALPGIEIEVVPFLDDMPRAIARSHLVVSRAGAITLAELCAAGRPSLLVPLALAGGHQRHNAERLVQGGAAEMLAGEEADAEHLADLLRRLLGNHGRLEAMAQAARRLGHRDAAARIADRVEHLGGPG